MIRPVALVITLLDGAIWTFLALLNIVRYFHGWWQDYVAMLIGLIPFLGLGLVATQIWLLRRHRERGVAVIGLAALLIAALYLFGALTDVAN